MDSARFWNDLDRSDGAEVSNSYRESLTGLLRDLTAERLAYGTTAASSEYQMLDSMFTSMSPVYPSFVEPQLNQLESLMSPAWPAQRPPSPLQPHMEFENSVEIHAPNNRHDPFTGYPKPNAATPQFDHGGSLLTAGGVMTPNEVYSTLVKP